MRYRKLTFSNPIVLIVYPVAWNAVSTSSIKISSFFCKHMASITVSFVFIVWALMSFIFLLVYLIPFSVCKSFTDFTNSPHISNRIFFCKFMSIRAIVFSSVVPSSFIIFTLSNCLKMFWINAKLIQTQMVYVKTPWNFSFHKLIRKSMGWHRFFIPYVKRTIITIFTRQPLPACFGFMNLFKKPLYHFFHNQLPITERYYAL